MNLKINYLKGKPVTGYLYLASAKNYTRSKLHEKVGIVLDFATDQLIGIEILAFDKETKTVIEKILKEHQIPVQPNDLSIL